MTGSAGRSFAEELEPEPSLELFCPAIDEILWYFAPSAARRAGNSSGATLRKSPASPAKNRSNRAGAMISIRRAGFGPGFQNVCGTMRGLKTYVPGPASMSSSPMRAPIRPSRM
jgi:hypothetical protein